jgi:putative heme-binding domain-containing protein
MSRAFVRLSMLLALLWPISLPVRSHGQQSNPQPASANSLVEGQRIFATTCAACHGLDARGGERGPDIVNRKDVQQMPDEALLRIVQDGKPGTGMPAFRSLSIAQTQAVVLHLRSLQGRATAEPLPGDSERGRGLFFGKAECSKCHMAHGEGGFIGSDLSSYARGKSAEDIRSAVTDPDKNLDPRKRPVTVTTMNGRTQTGMARNEDNFSLQLQSLDGAFHLFAKSDLRSVEYQTRSLMPSDYGSTLSPQELDDLVSYLMNISRAETVQTGNKPSPANDE